MDTYEYCYRKINQIINRHADKTSFAYAHYKHIHPRL